MRGCFSVTPPRSVTRAFVARTRARRFSLRPRHGSKLRSSAAPRPRARVAHHRHARVLRAELPASTRSALDPRPDTETLIEAALALVEQDGQAGRAASSLLDLGTGTGCILVSRFSPSCRRRVASAPISACGALVLPKPMRVASGLPARASLRRLRLARCASHGEFDLIVSNPPYIASGEIESLAPEVAHHDPYLALDGGPDGLEAYRRIAAGPAKLLAPKGADSRSRSAPLRPPPWPASCATEDFSSRTTALAATSEAGPEWLWQPCDRMPRSEASQGKKGAWKFAVFRVGSMPANEDFRPVALRKPGRLQRQQDRISREPRLKGSLPLGTFRRRSTAHQD